MEKCRIICKSISLTFCMHKKDRVKKLKTINTKKWKIKYYTVRTVSKSNRKS